MDIQRNRQATLARLRSKLRQCGQSEAEYASDQPAPGPLGSLLAGAWRPGGVIEFVGNEACSLTLAGVFAREIRSRVLLVDSSEMISPFALSLLGLDPSRLLVVRPGNKQLALWAVEQSLRCPGIGVTVCRLGPRLGTTAARRLKLAAEVGSGIGLVIRPAAREPPFGDLRLVVKPLPSLGMDTLRPRLEIEVVYQRGGTEGALRHGRHGDEHGSATCEIELSDNANLVPVVSPVVRSADLRLRWGG